jgi:hypothetical protein
MGAPIAVAVVSADDRKGGCFQKARLGHEQPGDDHLLPQLHPARPTIMSATNVHRAGETRMVSVSFRMDEKKAHSAVDFRVYSPGRVSSSLRTA